MLKTPFDATPQLDSTLALATMDEWWALTATYKDHRRPSHALLKEHGYLRLFQLLEQLEPERALEFGHGFNHSLLSRFQDSIEMHGVDDYQALPYFPPRDEWETYYDQHIRANCKACTLHRGLLGGDGLDVEPGSFDVIVSVSVLEELPREELERVLAHAARLLRPGGRSVFAGTFDVQINRLEILDHFHSALRAAGFEVPPAQEWVRPTVGDNVLLESPTTVMMTYYMGQGERDRRFAGHWGTAWFCLKLADRANG